MPNRPGRGYPRPDTGQTRITREVTLDGFLDATMCGGGVALQGLTPLTSLVVHTRNTRYHIIVLGGDEIVIQGGAFFADPTPARFEGASAGRSLLRVGWIGVGLRMEIRAAGQRVVTTAVRSIICAGPESGKQPH